MLTDAELHAELERLLSEHFGAARHVVDLAQRPNPYRSSHAIQELDVALDDGRRLQLIRKDLSGQALDEAVREATPNRDPRREIEVYRRLLAHDGMGTATCYGAVADREGDSFWLLLERVPGERLAFVGDFATWEEVARWLARMHERLARVGVADGLLRYDSDLFRGRLASTQASVERSGADGSLLRRFERLVSVYDQVVERLVTLPPTIVHGEFYAENVLVEHREDGLRVCPVDWEMAGVGPSLVDLAGLIAGSWTPDEKRALALAYHGALESERPPADEFVSSLRFSQIQLALQWAGAAACAERRDQVEPWLTEALDTADELGL